MADDNPDQHADSHWFKPVTEVPAELYHGTSIENALAILKAGFVGQPDRHDSTHTGVSTSTELLVASDFADRRESEDSGNQYGVILVLDGPALLKAGLQIIPFNTDLGGGEMGSTEEAELRVLGSQVPVRFITGLFYSGRYDLAQGAELLKRIMANREEPAEEDEPETATSAPQAPFNQKTRTMEPGI